MTSLAIAKSQCVNDRFGSKADISTAEPASIGRTSAIGQKRTSPQELPTFQPREETCSDLRTQFKPRLCDGSVPFDCSNGGKSTLEHLCIPGPRCRSRDQAGNARKRLSVGGLQVRGNCGAIPLATNLYPRWELEEDRRRGLRSFAEDMNNVGHSRERCGIHIALVRQRTPQLKPRLRLSIRLWEADELLQQLWDVRGGSVRMLQLTPSWTFQTQHFQNLHMSALGRKRTLALPTCPST